jgi:dephospho-CoA kinase
MHRLGLTGGMGSGKSTVAALLARQGAHLIDADAIARANTGPNAAAIGPLRAAFGSTFFTLTGALDRQKMRALIYANAPAKSQLEAIIHPLVQAQISQQAQLAQNQGARCIVFDIPLLLESGHWRKLLDRIVVVDCMEQTQIARVTQRDGLSPAEVRRILDSQASRASRLRIADLVLFNDGISAQHLADKVQQIAAKFGL